MAMETHYLLDDFSGATHRKTTRTYNPPIPLYELHHHSMIMKNVEHHEQKAMAFVVGHETGL